MKTKEYILIGLLTAFLLVLLPLSSESQTISRNKKKPSAPKTEQATKKPKQANSSTGSGKSKKTSKNNAQQSSSTSRHSKQSSSGMSQAQKDRIIQQAINDMVYVEGGTFMMGATSEQGSDAHSDEYPVHQVSVSSFYISKYEVTQELWQAVMGKNPSSYKGDLQRPVDNVSWDDCQEFISKLNRLSGKRFRMLSEAEWEYAARGGSQSRGYKYSGSNNIDDVAWYSHNRGENSTHPVGQKAPNELGLYDMSGNVSELCQDWYSFDYSEERNQNYHRVNRGGRIYSPADACRVSHRGIYPTNGHGLRLAASSL